MENHPNSDYRPPMKWITTSLIVVISLLLQSMISYAAPIDMAEQELTKTAVIYEFGYQDKALKGSPSACCDDQKTDTSAASSCSGSDCKFFFSTFAYAVKTQAIPHTMLAVVEDFSFHSAVHLRPPNS